MLERSYLIQRLKNPYPVEHQKILGVFSFGGGLKNGGLNDDFMDIIHQIFSFDYMGAAEFEFGALPKAFQAINKNVENFVTSELKHKLGTIYIFCNEEDVDEIKSRINGWIKNLHENLKEPTLLKLSLTGKFDYSKSPVSEDRRIQAWLELDNGFFFSRNKEMFDKFVGLWSGEK